MKKTRQRRNRVAPAPGVPGDTMAPAQGQGEHNPLPWSLVIAGTKSGVIDAGGKLVLECDDAYTAVDIANLELIVRSVNARQDDDAPFQAVAPFAMEDVPQASSGCVPMSESSETGGIGGA